MPAAGPAEKETRTAAASATPESFGCSCCRRRCVRRREATKQTLSGWMEQVNPDNICQQRFKRKTALGQNRALTFLNLPESACRPTSNAHRCRQVLLQALR